MKNWIFVCVFFFSMLSILFYSIMIIYPHNNGGNANTTRLFYNESGSDGVISNNETVIKKIKNKNNTGINLPKKSDKLFNALNQPNFQNRTNNMLGDLVSEEKSDYKNMLVEDMGRENVSNSYNLYMHLYENDEIDEIESVYEIFKFFKPFSNKGTHLEYKNKYMSLWFTENGTLSIKENLLCRQVDVHYFKRFRNAYYSDSHISKLFKDQVNPRDVVCDNFSCFWYKWNKNDEKIDLTTKKKNLYFYSKNFRESIIKALDLKAYDNKRSTTWNRCEALFTENLEALTHQKDFVKIKSEILSNRKLTQEEKADLIYEQDKRELAFDSLKQIIPELGILIAPKKCYATVFEEFLDNFITFCSKSSLFAEIQEYPIATFISDRIEENIFKQVKNILGKFNIHQKEDSDDVCKLKLKMFYGRDHYNMTLVGQKILKILYPNDSSKKHGISLVWNIEKNLPSTFEETPEVNSQDMFNKRFRICDDQDNKN